MVSARHVHKPSISPRLCANSAAEEGIAPDQTCPAALSSARKSARKNRGRGVIRAAVAVALIASTFLLLPGQVAHPPGAPLDSDGVDRSVDAMSVAALYSTPYGGEQFISTDLSWSWNITGGKSEATLFAIVRSREASGSLVFGGPISRLVSECHLNGQPIDPSNGMPNSLGFNPPENAMSEFYARKAGTIRRIDFQGDPGPGGTVIRCHVHDFASDDPPVHRLYTPRLLAYSEGSEPATEEDFRLRTVCVHVPFYSETESTEECADTFNAVPMLADRVQLLNLPEEQGIRDAKLLIVGAVAGTAAATLLELLTGFLSALFRSAVRMFHALKKWGRASPTATINRFRQKGDGSKA